MLQRWWYTLVPDGSLEPPSEESKGCVDLPEVEVVFNLKNTVHEKNKIRVGHCDAMSLKVSEHDGKVLSDPAKKLSDCASGGPQKPFIVYYPVYPGRTLSVCMFIVHA